MRVSAPRPTPPFVSTARLRRRRRVAINRRCIFKINVTCSIPSDAGFHSNLNAPSTLMASRLLLVANSDAGSPDDANTLVGPRLRIRVHQAGSDTRRPGTRCHSSVCSTNMVASRLLLVANSNPNTLVVHHGDSNANANKLESERQSIVQCMRLLRKLLVAGVHEKVRAVSRCRFCPIIAISLDYNVNANEFKNPVLFRVRKRLHDARSVCHRDIHGVVGNVDIHGALHRHRGGIAVNHRDDATHRSRCHLAPGGCVGDTGCDSAPRYDGGIYRQRQLQARRRMLLWGHRLRPDCINDNNTASIIQFGVEPSRRPGRLAVKLCNGEPGWNPFEPGAANAFIHKNNILCCIVNGAHNLPHHKTIASGVNTGNMRPDGENAVSVREREFVLGIHQDVPLVQLVQLGHMRHLQSIVRVQLQHEKTRLFRRHLGRMGAVQQHVRHGHPISNGIGHCQCGAMRRIVRQDAIAIVHRHVRMSKSIRTPKDFGVTAGTSSFAAATPKGGAIARVAPVRVPPVSGVPTRARIIAATAEKGFAATQNAWVASTRVAALFLFLSTAS